MENNKSKDISQELVYLFEDVAIDMGERFLLHLDKYPRAEGVIKEFTERLKELEHYEEMKDR